MELKRKTPIQLQALEKFYSEDKCPTQKAVKGYAAALGLTHKQVQGWFAERRRRDRRGGELGDIPLSELRRRCLLDVANRTNSADFSSSGPEHVYSAARKMMSTSKRRKRPFCIQDMLFTPDYILKKIFRKDGPALGMEFDSLPASAFSRGETDSQSNLTGTVSARQAKRTKVPIARGEIQRDCNSLSVRRHGIGKGLMAVWRLTNPSSEDLDASSGISVCGAERPSPPIRKKRPQSVARKLRQREMQIRKKKPLLKKRKVPVLKDKMMNQIPREKCGLALDGVIGQNNLERCGMLEDDEELELRELRAWQNPLSTCDHCTSSHEPCSCSLCQDVLVKFPPYSVKMRKPFSAQPWNFSLEMVKKLFKAFNFVYTYAVLLEVDSFTLDEFAQAFHDKDSLILGKVHLALLKVLIHNIENELTRNCFGGLHKSCKLLALLRSVENHTNLVEFWKKALNPLTWSEILRQVMVAAGFGSNKGSLGESISKDLSQMIKYGLRPATLKGKLFRLLLEHDNCGLRVSEMAKCPQVLELRISDKTEELEDAIYSALSSDITLFEKISSSTYRLRANCLSENAKDSQSDSEDSGTVDDQCDNDNISSASDESECDTEALALIEFKPLTSRQKKRGKVALNTEIDESHPGVMWLLGLMEGEYSCLSIEEKLDAFVALVDLLSALSTIMIEEQSKQVPEKVSSSIYFGSGGKIKKASAYQSARESWVHNEKGRVVDSSREACPVDSSVLLSNLLNKKSSFGCLFDAERLTTKDIPHPMQSIFLGSDRRYNRYWLFLGPCTTCDPGHRRLYFESSEDGHWEVMDSAEALHSLLSVLDERGMREAVLIENLEIRKCLIVQAMSESASSQAFVRSFCLSRQDELDTLREQSSSPVSDVDNNAELSSVDKYYAPSSGVINLAVGMNSEDQGHLRAFDSWIWNCFYLELNAVKYRKSPCNYALKKCEKCHDLYWRDEKHCKDCHTTFELDFDLEEKYAIHTATCGEKEERDTQNHKVLSSQLQSLKAACHAIESAMPENALIGAWTNCSHKLWVRRLRRASSITELLQVLADFVRAINRDWLSSSSCSVTGYDGILGEEIVAQIADSLAIRYIDCGFVLTQHFQDDCIPDACCTGFKVARHHEAQRLS
ncbi:hypothetical protein MLD38_021563 [Melastoma candidum]|uniref:Uncharacterized protein n=1 Tax=Melastoma candidum TaxID=119954 RepID=A0ACB9QFW9_9MYRT|nr:hypothetical protein MLD38_021563 [Melastoma candidum]